MIRRKVFSNYSEEALISAIEERAFCEGYIAAQKEFGAQSKALGIFAPGAYSGKELAKLEANNPEEYHELRNKAALKGLIAPISTTRKLAKAHKMAEQGATPDEIRKAIGSAGAGAMALEALTAPVSRPIGHIYAKYRGLADMDRDTRREAKKRTKQSWED